MINRYLFQIGLGIFCFACVLMFGQKGFASFAFYALLALFGRQKPDERELYLFYKTGNATMGLMILVMVVVHFLQNQVISGFRIGDNWMVICATAMPLIQGIVGVYLLKSAD